LAQLLEELRERDPEAHAKIDKSNPRRVIRAVEIVRTTGKPLAASQADWGQKKQEAKGAPLILCVRSSGDLRHRIDSRVDFMFQRGLVDETWELLKHGLAENRTAMQAIGYRQAVEHLRGERSLAETIELVKIRTRQFAKRQLTWFHRHARCKKVELKPEETAEEILQRLSS
jgi:tRNA dimethylallyltransferase